MRKIQKRAFTLIELLVVIAIIAILAAILFPVFAQAKLAAKKTQSLSNVKQLSTGVAIYGGDSDDVFPVVDIVTADQQALSGNNLAPVGWYDRYDGTNSKTGYNDANYPVNWAKELFPYEKSDKIFVNPANVSVSGGGSVLTTSGAVATGYSYNGAVAGRSATSPSAPADLVVFQGMGGNTREADTYPDIYGYANGSIGANGFFSWTSEVDEWSTPMTYGTGGTPLCHDLDVTELGASFNGGDNYAFADGHAKFMKRNAVSFRNFGWQTVFRENNGFAPESGTTTKLQDLTQKSRRRPLGHLR